MASVEDTREGFLEEVASELSLDKDFNYRRSGVKKAENTA